jgi:hypothetical protein
MRLMVELDGVTVPLADCRYVLWSACGCPRGATACGGRVVSEDDAWKSLFPTKRERDWEQKRGMRMELMTHERWVTEVMRLRECPHKTDTADGAAS